MNGWMRHNLRILALACLLASPGSVCAIGGNAPPPSPQIPPPPVIKNNQANINIFGTPIILDNPTGGGGGGGPPIDSPEPATLVSGLCGAVLASLWCWRRRSWEA